MKKLYILFLLMGLLSFSTMGRAAITEKLLTYQSYPSEEALDQVLGKITVKMKNISKDQTTIVRQKEVEDKVINDEFVLDKDYSLKAWTRTSEEEDTDFSSERVGDKLVIKGKINGEMIDKEIVLGSKLLYIYPKYSLSKFAMSNLGKIKFWTLRRDKMEKLLMKARKEGEETIVVNGRDVDVIKVYYAITGKLREKHYNHNYYYRKSDGLFVKKEDNKGRIEELVKEQY